VWRFRSNVNNKPVSITCGDFGIWFDRNVLFVFIGTCD